MLELTLTAATGAVSWMLRKESATTPPNGLTEANTTVVWNPEGPSILTELWMLTLLPHGTKLHFEIHHVTHDIPDKSFFPQMITRTWTGDSRADIKKLIEATKIALNICPPTKLSGKEPIPSINKIYLGAREGLLKLAITYGYTINLEEFRRQQTQDSMMLTPKVKKDKADKDRKPRKAITNCITLIDRALSEGVKETELQDLSKRVRENWKHENFNAIVLYMQDAKKKIEDNQSSKECLCKNEIQILQGMLNAKIDDYIRFTRECGSHKFTRSMTAHPAAAAANTNSDGLSRPVDAKGDSQSAPPPPAEKVDSHKLTSLVNQGEDA